MEGLHGHGVAFADVAGFVHRPRRKPVTAPAIETPTSPMTVEAPVLVTADRPSTPKLSAEPRGTGCAATNDAETSRKATAMLAYRAGR